MKFKTSFGVAVLAAFAFGSLADDAPLSADERAVTAWIDGHTGGLESLVEAQVNINSGTRNPAGVAKVGALLGSELTALGFATETIRLPDEMHRAGHLVARHPGKQGQRILLIGHLDTVFEPDDAFQKFKREPGNWASGPGVNDMKSGNAIIVYALKALAAAGALDNTQVQVVYSGDEEDPGDPLAVTRKALVDAGKWADVALEFESGIRDQTAEWATVARRSSTDWCLEVTGKQAHSSGIFDADNGAGAIYETARILDEFYQKVRGEKYLTFSAGTIVGGTEIEGDCHTPRSTVFGKTNIIPSRAIVRGDMRTISDQQTERTRAAMRAIVARSLPHTLASISFEEGYPAMAPTDGNLRLQAMLSEINVQLGGKPMPALDPSRRGAADSSFVAPYADILAGMGAYGEGEHSPAERLDLASLPIATKRAALLIYKLTRK